MNKKLFWGSASAIVLVIIASLLMLNQFQSAQDPMNDTGSYSLHIGKEITLKEKSYTTQAVIGAIGDVLLHNTVYQDAEEGDSYNFLPMFQVVETFLQAPDFMIANQESLPGGAHLGVSSYPAFNSPYEIVDALQKLGVDAVTTANNHSLDKGTKGVLSAISHYEEIGMPYTGSFKSEEDRKNIRTFNVNGISFALLAYTYGTNGIPVPQGKDYLVNLIDLDLMKKDIQKAKELGVDMVVLAAHWGNEYERFPNETQQSLARELTNAGVDLIIGHHPHVLQPIEKLTTDDGREAVVIYSLGNFLSGQEGDLKNIGGIANVTVQKVIDENGKRISFPEIGFQPTFVTQSNYNNYRILPLAAANQSGLVSFPEDEMVSHVMNIQQ
ncbi:CapA family protein [Bacillus sp. SCS-153A]|uniref:CapA family protein n=1 Tax=Rossellomorea sedimentorum TaxID=3115294 RepID=UPI0039062EDD